MKARASGFTLIELLVVIVIIGLLAGLAVPAIGKAQRSARMSASQSNLRQIGVAVHAYVADTGKYPHGTDAGLGDWLPSAGQIEPTWRGYWSDILSPYVGLNSYWGSQTSPIFDSPAKLVKTAVPDRAFLPNPNIIQDTQWGNGEVITAVRVSRPSETVLLGDGVQHPVQGWVHWGAWGHPDVYDNDLARANDFVGASDNIDDGTAKFRFRYNNKGHFLFCDGHVELIENGKLRRRNFAIAY